MVHFLRCLADLLVMALIYLFFLRGRWRAKGRSVLILHSLLYVYIGAVCCITIMPILASLPVILKNLADYPWQTLNLLPFNDYLNGRGDTVRQIVLNVILMVPFGFFMPLVKKSNLLVCIAQTFFFSLGIELFQPLVFRSGDITDLITNTVGGIAGYFLYLAMRPAIGAVLARIDPQ
jgi:glycopeptide antibiotics resistance protein